MHQMYASPGQRGAVRNPQLDRRLKENRDNPLLKRLDDRRDIQPGGQGRVKDPTKDRRLKSNRSAGG